MNIEHYKKLLISERDRLKAELPSVGHINPNNPSDWQANKTDMDAERSDVIDTADNMEEYHENTAILNELEIRLSNVLSAISRIEDGKFGMCSDCGKEVEEDRLEANPAATTCKIHMD